ncbi:gfo/Idh/MocA family oxidoreductase [Streptomyces sp. p1417]|uniref:Gfo/Idh/MocA family oxidoreductase n=1 Tax=Streptomyces typhae TaxID=2681492 RepID=A0A6L6X973_9ACTN|nr:Gfo/Idh/MocA family oxidoreductase [Streptomyces typhae]MVO90438.1 gfo/Idh/MocA family oxidoreductase [Streptomyces typhae]
MSGRVRWGLLVTGAYADVAMRANAGSRTTEFVAVAHDDAASARAYADRHGLARAYGTYEELLADDEVEAVFVAVDPVGHAPAAIRALRAGKHVVVEKPLALTAKDADEVFRVAEEAGRLCMEGIFFRHHPRTLLAKRLLGEGVIGELRYLYAACTANLPPDYFRRHRELGGGGLFDLGAFTLSAIRFFGGSPERVYAEEVRRDGGADLNFSAQLRLPGDVLAQFEVGQEVCRGDALHVVGTTGRFVLDDPWFSRDVTHLELQRQGPPPHADPVSEYLPVDPEGAYGCGGTYAVSRMQFDDVSRAVLDGTEPPFGRADAVEQAAVMDALLESGAHARAVTLGR